MINPAIEQLLYLIAEVSIATVALSGITMFLAVSDLRMDNQRASLITTQLRMAFAVTVFSVAPLFFSQFDLATAIFWRLSSALYLSGVIYLWLQGGILAKREEARLRPPKLAVFAGLSAVLLLPFNIWQPSPWPYLLQLLIAWSASMILYLGFIQEALTQKVANDSRGEPRDD